MARALAQPPLATPFAAAAQLRRLIHVSRYVQIPDVHPHPQIIRDDCHYIEVVFAGAGEVWHEETWQPVEPGSLLWHIGGDQTIGRSNWSNPYQCLAVQFGVTAGSPRPVPRCNRWDDLGELPTFIAYALRVGTVPEGPTREAATLALWSRLTLEAQLAPLRSKLPIELRRVVELIDGRFGDDLSIDDLARTAGWSTAHLHERFRQHLDLTPHRYLLNRRIAVARDLLTTTNDPIASIARSCGFAAAAPFCRAFRAAVGLTPGTFRERG